MDKSTMFEIARRALAEIQLEIEVKDAFPMPEGADWCITFATGYGQVCVAAGPGSTNDSIKEEIKHQLLNRGTS